MASITLTAIEGVPIVKSGDDLAALIAKGLDQTGLTLQNGDIVIVCQKVISKAEGRMVDLKTHRAVAVREAICRAMGKGSTRGGTGAATDQSHRAQ